MKTKSPFHSHQGIRIASPCSANWARMAGNDRVRYCSECQLNVYDLSALSVSEVEQLVVNHEGRLCGRFYRRLDGTVLTRDCPLGFRSALRRISRLTGAVLSAVMSINFANAQAPPRNMSSLVQIERKGEIALAVTDQSGALVPNARVSLVSEATHRKQDGITDSTGRLRLSNLNAGSYVLTVGWPGFETESRVISLSQGQIVEMQVTLKVAPLMGVVVSIESAAVEPEPLPESITRQLDQVDSSNPDVKPVSHSNVFKKLFSSIGHKL